MRSARRTAAAALGTAILTLTATLPAAAEGPTLVGTQLDEHYGAIHLYTDEAGVHVVGQFDTWEIYSRWQDTNVTLLFKDADGAQVLGTTLPLMLRTAVRVSQIPWHAVIPEADLADATTLSVSYYPGVSTATIVPVGGLDVSPATLSGLTATGTVQNDGTVEAIDVVVYGTLQSVSDLDPNESEGWLDTAASTTIPSLAPGETATYTITFNAAAQSGTVVEVVAETESGPYMTNWENYFDDILISYGGFAAAIIGIAREGIVSGCGPGRFCGARGVTRAQLAAFLDRALALPNTHVDYFTDDEESFAEDSINRLAEADIVHGCADGAFCPNGRVNRGQMAKFLVRAYDVPPSDADAFADDSTSTTEAYHDALAAAGLSIGCNVGPIRPRYCPNDPLLRRELAQFLFRAEQYVP
jgi:hypothetical protein